MAMLCELHIVSTEKYVSSSEDFTFLMKTQT